MHTAFSNQTSVSLREQLTTELQNPLLRQQLERLPAGSALRIQLLASKASQTGPDDLSVTLMVAQQLLVEAGLLPDSTFVAFQPSPLKRHRPGTAEQLALYDLLKRHLQLACLTLNKAPSDEEREATQCSLLLIASVLEGGILSRRELRSFLRSAASQGVRVMGLQHFVNAPGKSDGGETLDNRRVHLSPLLRALLLGQTPATLQDLADDPDRALRPVAKQLGLKKLSLSDIMMAMSAYCEHGLRLPLWLISWMRHSGIYSSCLVEDNLLRINRFLPPDTMPTTPPTPSLREGSARPTYSGKSRPEDNDVEREGRTSGEEDPLEPAGDDLLFREVGRILRAPGVTSKATSALIMELKPAFYALGVKVPAATMLYDWLMDLHQTFTKPSTIRLSFFAVASRLLAYGSSLTPDEITQDDLILLREQLIEEGLANSTLNNVAVALNHLIKFLNKSRHDALAPVPTGIAVALANARVLVPSDVSEVMDYLSSARCRLPMNHRSAAQTLVFLAFHTGLRRQEALHLDWRQIRGIPADISVRNSVANRLKTLTSRRDIPIGLLDIHHHVISHDFKKAQAGLVIHPDRDSKSNWLIPGQANHVKFGEAIVREVHRVLQKVSGDSEITLHSLRHSCATILLLLLLAKRFRLHDLKSHFPFLADILTPEAEELAKSLLCPASYQDDAELAAIREILGHSSETMTLAHYVHCLDMLRMAALRPEWVSDTTAIGRAAGLSDYLIASHSIGKLLERQEKRTCLYVTYFMANDNPRYKLITDSASKLVRQMTAVSLPIQNEAKLNRILAKVDHGECSPAEFRRMQARQSCISPKAVAFLSNKSRATSLASITPLSRWRDDAIWFCENILRGEGHLSEDERNHYRHTLAMDARRILENSTNIRSSTICIPDLATYRSLEFASWHILGVPVSHHDFFVWKKVGNTHRPKPLSSRQVELALCGDCRSLPSVFAKLNIPRELSCDSIPELSTRARNPLSIVTWIMATYYILFGSH